MPFAVDHRDGVLTLTLDTPGSPVNIFNHAAARQLSEILAQVRPADTRAIVIDSAKPGSFLNGVGLLLAHASQTRAALVAASTPPWTAYHALAEAPVPTIAFIDGTCFGCGVELSLCCDYRIASPSGETCFYMTELNDYLFVPLFGSTWTLPEAVGFEDAVDLLLWGRRWDGPTAVQRGLADAVLPVEPRERAALVGDVLAGRVPSRRRGPVVWGEAEDRVLARTRARIAALPPSHHPVYGDALALLETGARRPDSLVAHQRRELDRSAASALAAVGKSAYSFFYVRQMASERALGRTSGDGPLSLSADDDVRVFANRLRARPLAGVTFEEPASADVLLVSPDAPKREHTASAQTTLRPESRHLLALCAPTIDTGGRLIELAVAPDADPILSARLARALQRWGFEVARTGPGADFACHRLLLAFLEPLVAYGDTRTVNTTLRHAGFARRPHALLAALGQPATLDGARGVVPLHTLRDDAFDDGDGDPVILDALAVSLLHAILAMRADGQLRDPAVVDLIARELLDFPLTLRSLCTWLRRTRIATALEHAPDLARLVSPATLDTARAFVATGRDFYRVASSAAASGSAAA